MNVHSSVLTFLSVIKNSWNIMDLHENFVVESWEFASNGTHFETQINILIYYVPIVLLKKYSNT